MNLYQIYKEIPIGSKWRRKHRKGITSIYEVCRIYKDEDGVWISFHAKVKSASSKGYSSGGTRFSLHIMDFTGLIRVGKLVRIEPVLKED